MKKALFAFAFMFLASCSGCLSLGQQWSYGDDYAAGAAQALMRGTVVIASVGMYVDPTDPQEPGKIAVQGSGTIIAKKNNHTLVMTAAHVCNMPEVVEKTVDGKKIVYRRALQLFNVIDVDLNDHYAKVVVTGQSNENDICILDVEGNFGSVVLIADTHAPIGGFVTFVGAPRQNFDYHMFWVSDGRYCGRQRITEGKNWFDTYTFPSGPGGSGGGIFYHNRLVGVLSRAEMSSGHTSYGVELVIVKTFVKRALEAWKP